MGQGPKFHEVFQLKQGRYSDLPAAKITEMMKSNSLDNAPTQSLLSVVNGILDESIERKNAEIPHRVACLLRKVVQEIERRISTQADHIRSQNTLIKAREEKYQSRIKVLETLASGTNEETKIVANQLQKTKTEKNSLEESKKHGGQDIGTLMKEKGNSDCTISELKQELANTIKLYEDRLQKEKGNNDRIMLDHKQELENANKLYEDKLMKEKDHSDRLISELKQELENINKSHVDRLMNNGGGDNTVSELKQELVNINKSYDDRLKKEKASSDRLISELKQELESINKSYEDRLKKEKGDSDLMISELKQELENMKKWYEDKLTEKGSSDQTVSQLNQDVVRIQKLYAERLKEIDMRDLMISQLKKDFENSIKSNENHCQQLERNTKEIKEQLEERIKQAESLLAESRKRTREVEAFSESNLHKWKKKEHVLQNFVGFQLESVKNMRVASKSVEEEVKRSQDGLKEEMTSLGLKLKVLVTAAENYHMVLSENRRLYNEVLELKGNIRVFCRIRPFLPSQKGKATIVDCIGENGEVGIINPSKQGKDGRKMFNFNKVFGPSSTQEQVYLDIQPLVRSVVDGFNVCIFAYGQTGSGKTYTMSGPNSPTEQDWGVNYRALNDLFNLSRTRSSTFLYEIGVQMIEIYNEQVRDLLTSNSSTKKLGITNISQASGLAVPDASMLPVKSTSDVLELMEFGQSNRAMSSTASNERSSRSHSVVTVHVQIKDLKTGSTSRGCLHLIDLAGSERVDRSEVTGDRLKEAQHINKSLAALGDVIFALSQKSNHVPYRNSKLTQVLQGSLGGQAKTLMFVQVNPEADSYSETLSTLKFAERVAGVELGAAKSNKEGKDVKDLIEQVASLKDMIARKDEEIEELQLLKDSISGSPKLSKSLRHSSSSPGISSLKERAARLPSSRVKRLAEMSASDTDNGSEISDKQSDNGSQQSDPEISGFGDADLEERQSDTSDVEPETDNSTAGRTVPRGTLRSSETAKEKPKVSSRIARPLAQRTTPTLSSSRLKSKEPVKTPVTRKSTTSTTASPARPLKR